MELSLEHDQQLYKKRFEFKGYNGNGLLLNVQHFFSKNQSLRFIFGSFNNQGQILGLADNLGQIFILDFFTKKHWVIPETFPECTYLRFSAYQDDLLVATKTGVVHILDVQIGSSRASLAGHKHPVSQMSFSRDSRCLTASCYEAIIWNLKDNSKIQVLNLDQKHCNLKQVTFMPVSYDIMVCFNDDIIEIWDSSSFRIKTQLRPSLWFGHAVKNITFSLDGKSMVITIHPANLALVLLSNHKLIKFVTLPEALQTVKLSEFIPHLNDGGSNKILTLLNGRGNLYFYDIDQDVVLNEVTAPGAEIIKLNIAPRGVFLSCILNSGAVMIYDFIQLTTPPKPQMVRAVSRDNSKFQKSLEKLQTVKQEIKDLLTIEKMALILKQYGQYPESYRSKIWEELLQLPNLINEYNTIINHRVVKSFEELTEKYPLTSARCLKNLRQLLDNLVSWCPFLLNVEYLPLFIFPFVRFFDKTPVVCFEAMCTIILNWCQFWFEYFPLPPLNILSLIENMLLEQDPGLLKAYTDAKIYSEMYAWNLLKTAFSEVLTAQEWKIFWDHVLTNEPSFLLCAVVAYNILQRGVILKSQTQQEVALVFTSYHPISVKNLIRKTYSILKTTTDHLHPRQYLGSFRHVEESGGYRMLPNYPKEILDWQSAKKEEIKKQETLVSLDELELLKQRLSNYESLKQIELNKEESRRLLAMKKMLKESIMQDQESLQNQLDRVAQLRALNKEEGKLLNLMRHKEKSELKILTLESMLRDDSPFQFGRNLKPEEEDLLLNYSDLLRIRLQNKSDLEGSLRKSSLRSGASTGGDSFRRHQKELFEKVKQIRKLPEDTVRDHLTTVNLITGVNAIDSLIDRIEHKLDISEGKAEQTETSKEVLLLRVETDDLVQGVNKLLRTLGKNRRSVVS